MTVTHDLDSWLAAVRRAIAAELSCVRGDWQDDGRLVVGPDHLAVRVECQHAAGEHHVDLGFVLDRERADGPIVWDCVSGVGENEAAAAQVAARLWCQTTAPTVLELLARDGEYADHAHGDATLGLASWHSIHGAIIAYGDQPDTLQRWCLDHAVVPRLREQLAAALTPDAIHGVKFFLGRLGDRSIAEVRIDGVADAGCSEALLALPWPKQTHAVARFFVLFVHPL